MDDYTTLALVLSTMSLFEGAFDPASIRIAGDVLLKLGIGALIGGAIGLERELHGRPAGIRTHMMMVIGVVLYCEVSKAFAPNDPARIAAQILTGVGFLGAGTILRLGAEIKGLTSAASIWAAAALGMAVSTGGAFFWVAIVGTVLALITLAVVDDIERRLVPHAHPRSLQIEIDSMERFADVARAVASAGGKVKGARFTANGAGHVVELDVQGSPDPCLAAVGSCPGVKDVRWMD